MKKIISKEENGLNTEIESGEKAKWIKKKERKMT